MGKKTGAQWNELVHNAARGFNPAYIEQMTAAREEVGMQGPDIIRVMRTMAIEPDSTKAALLGSPYANAIAHKLSKSRSCQDLLEITFLDGFMAKNIR